ncbi:MAG: hypothetical protein JO116_00135 [Planctomycetaceae bacterium]|nr:hypothetical protein [Planctomycetaceae bacterium]
MSLLLIAMGVFVVGGLLALVAGRLPLVSTILGAGAAVVGGIIGLVPTLGALLHGTTDAIHRAWDVPFGSFTAELDPLSALFLVPILGLSALAATYGSQYLFAYRGRKSLGPPWFFFNVLAASMVMVVVARNGVLFLVAWEVMSLSSYFLVTFEDEDATVREAGRTYLIATHLGTAFLLALFLLLGRRSGSLDFAEIAAAGAPAQAGFLFLLAIVGFGTKAGLMPFHVWLPEAHPAAPSHVSAVMSGVMVKTGIYGLVRTLTLLPGPAEWWGWLLVGVGIISGIGGILFALPQHDLKRMLAYSTVENVGVIAMGMGIGLVGMSTGRPELAVLGFSGMLLHVVNHSLFKGLLFLGAGTILHATGTRRIDQLGGLSKRMPWVAGAFLVGAVAITGVPPLNGFVSEFLIYTGAFREEITSGTSSSVAALGVIAALALIGGLAALGFAKAFGIVFLGEPRTEEAWHAHAPGVLMTAPMAVLALGCVLVGLFPAGVVSALMPAVSRVVRQGPEAVTAAAVAPLSSVATAAWGLLGLVLVLAVVREALLSPREVGVSGTWDCGYARPTARMQYTASSFVQPAIDFFAPVLWTRKAVDAPSGLFPRGASFATETPDLSEEVLYRPIFGMVGWTLTRLRWLQHGHVHVYVLYVGATLVALLVWYLGLRHS